MTQGCNTRVSGDNAEQAALDYLQSHGLQRVEQNFRCKLGELDLIMQDKQCMVFVEVRYRTSDRYGTSLATVTPAKQNKLRKTALFYLKARKLTEAAIRFDVVGMKPGERSASTYQFRWIKNAF